MEDNNNQTPKPTENNGTNKEDKPLQKYKGWTVDDLMAVCPSLTREEAEIAHRMGW